jgi:DNA-binding MarR family transcriptional regulator
MNRHEEVLVALRRIIRAVDLQSKRLMQTSGLSGPQLMIMQAIERAGSVTAGNLARSVSLSQGTVTSILDRLERKNLLRRVRSTEDKRKVVVFLSEEGKSALALAPTLLQENFIDSFQRLEDWEQHLLISSLQRIAQMMDAQHLDAAPYLETRILDEVSSG